MIFLSYDFLLFAVAFFGLYFLCPWPNARLAIVVGGGIVFQSYYGGLASIAPVAILAIITYFAGRSERRGIICPAIVLCALFLIFYKYTAFLIASVEPLLSGVGATVTAASQSLPPAAIPLGISFFTFEFVHYLTDVLRGGPPIRRLREFLAFGLFWPTMVAGPIKRYQQFIPAMHLGLSCPTADDAMKGLVRIAIGFAKKWAADNLTGWIEMFEPHFDSQSIGLRWLFVVALAFRILLDFSGYSDMAIGYARMMGIVVPENFNWPYLARSPIEFWQRWHMSLSLWIRDYIYIPLGGSRLGLPRRVVNALMAMAICGLWHGPSWHFVVWGIYHGLGLSFAALLQRALACAPSIGIAADVAVGTGRAAADSGKRIANHSISGAVRKLADVMGWACTMLFVGLGWLLFFYPVDKAMSMGVHLFLR